MTKVCGLLGSWVYGLALVSAWAGCTPRTDIGAGSEMGSGGEGLSSPQAGGGGSQIDGEGGSPQGGSPGSNGGSSAAAGGDPPGGSGGSTTIGGASGTSGSETGGTSGDETGGTSGSSGTGGSSGNETGGTSGTGDDGTSGDGDLLCGTLGNLDASSGLLLDLGLQGPIEWLERTDDRLLATDQGGNWALWNLNDKSILARGRAAERVGMDCPGCPRPDLAGDLFTLVSSTQLELRSLLDGSLITTVATPAEELHGTLLQANQGGLSPDGSYYWSGTEDGIKAWDESGTLLLANGGDYRLIYSTPSIMAAPDELRIARGPAGDGVIEHISIYTGDSTTSAFAGSFYSWFLDGGRFMTYQSSTLRVYDADTTTQEVLVPFPQGPVVGQGDYFWTVANGLTIYAVAEPSSPVATYAVEGGYDYTTYPNGQTYYAVGNRIGLIHKTDVTVVELDPAGVTDTTVNLPAAPGNWRYTADAAGKYALASQKGVVYDGADLERALSCGQTFDLAGSEQGTLAVATSIGLMLFELAPDSRRYVARIPFPSADVSLSRDGSVLAATSLHALAPRDGLGDAALRIWSLPERARMLTLSYPPAIYGLSLSATGNHFSYAWAENGYYQRVEDLHGNVAMTLNSVSISGIQISPDGSRVAVRNGRRGIDDRYSTQLYENGTLIDAFNGAPVLWLDQNRLLVDVVPTRDNPDVQRGARIYAVPEGFQPGPQLDAFHPDDEDDAAMLSETEIYSGHLNQVYSLSTGELLWSGPDADRGAVASKNIVYTVGDQVMFAGY